MQTIKKSHHKRNRFVGFVSLTLVLVIIAAGGWYYFYRNNTSSEPAYSADGINYAPGTKEDQTLADKNKEDHANSDITTTDPGSSETKKTVKPEVTSWGQSDSNYLVYGFVPDIIESDGTCTALMTKGSDAVKQSKVAFANAQDTTCGKIEIPLSKLSAGKWQLTISYDSSKSSGVSDPVTVEVD